MAGNGAEVARFAAAYAPLDDDALAALANRGLVRRAAKDLQNAAPQVHGVVGDKLRLTVEGQTVDLDELPARSVCSCASGMCRHILTGILYARALKTDASPAAAPLAPPGGAAAEAATGGTEPPPAPAVMFDPAELLNLSDEEVVKWSTRGTFQRGVKLALREVRFEEGASLLAHFPGQNLTVRWLALRGLEGMICSCHSPAPCEHRVAAVLAYQVFKGARPVEGAMPRAASAGAPRSREEVRDAIQHALLEAVATGLCRLSRPLEQRLRTLAISARGVDLPRMSRTLKGLADEVRLALAGDAQVDAAGLLDSAARAYALAEALERPLPHLVGEHRSAYEPVAGELRLTGFGARRWRSRSGYHGVTVYLWDAGAGRWTSWTDARPVGAPGFDPVTRFDQDGPWPGSGSPRQASSSDWRLARAFRNGAGRITSRSGTHGAFVGPARVEQGPRVTDWNTLPAVAERAFAPGIGGRREHDDLVLLAPAEWGPSAYDPVKQEVVRPVADAAGGWLPLTLRHSPETSDGLTTLEHADGSTLRGVLGALRLGAEGISVEPVTLWTDAGPIHLTIDGARHPAGVSPAAPAGPVDEEGVDGADDNAGVDIDAGDNAAPAPAATPLGRLLDEVHAEVLWLAESGAGVARDAGPLATAAVHLRNVGLAGCAASVEQLRDQRERHRKSVEKDSMAVAAALLRCAYVTRLASDCETLSAALAGGWSTGDLPAIR